MNTFEFNNTFYIQTHGTAMGTRMAPSYANLFLAKFETDALTHAPHQPHTWWRFIDDIFMIWTHTEDELRTFITYLSNIYPTIKFTSSHSATSISFLDVKISLSQFGMVESHSANLVWLRPISILSRQTNTNTLYNRLVTAYILNEPFHSITTHMLFRRKLHITRQ